MNIEHYKSCVIANDNHTLAETSPTYPTPVYTTPKWLGRGPRRPSLRPEVKAEKLVPYSRDTGREDHGECDKDPPLCFGIQWT